MNLGKATMEAWNSYFSDLTRSRLWRRHCRTFVNTLNMSIFVWREDEDIFQVNKKELAHVLENAVNQGLQHIWIVGKAKEHYEVL